LLHAPGGGRCAPRPLACGRRRAPGPDDARRGLVRDDDELLYERLAISVARHHSPLPRVHEALIPNVDQLYPLLLSPVFGAGPVAQSVQHAHFLNAFLVASACIPAYLLVRGVTGRALPAWLAAAASLCVPWLVLSSFLLTEVVAYPAFLWSVCAMLVALERPSWRHDVLALAGISLAV